MTVDQHQNACRNGRCHQHRSTTACNRHRDRSDRAEVGGDITRGHCCRQPKEDGKDGSSSCAFCVNRESVRRIRFDTIRPGRYSILDNREQRTDAPLRFPSFTPCGVSVPASSGHRATVLSHRATVRSHHDWDSPFNVHDRLSMFRHCQPSIGGTHMTTFIITHLHNNVGRGELWI
jgi:hypothetical protein